MLNPARPLRMVPLLAAIVAFASCRAPFEPDGGIVNPPPPPSAPLFPFRFGSFDPDFARVVVTDASGGYVAGYFSGTTDFDPSASATERVATGLYDISVARYRSDGTFQWVYAIGGTGADVPVDMKLSGGALYVTGYATSGAVCNGKVVPNAGDRDILLMRLTTAGTCVWAIGIGSSGGDEGHGVAIANDGSIIVTGSFSGSVDFDPGSGATILVSRGGTDGFAARYSTDGNFLGAVQFGGTEDDAANVAAVRADGDVIVAGSFRNIATFGSALAPVLLTSAGDTDFFLARLAPTLGLQWAVRGGGTGADNIPPNSIVLESSGLIDVAGNFTGSADLDPSANAVLVVSQGAGDVFLAQYASTGAFIGLAREFGGAGNDAVSVLARDASGNLYVGGSFQGAVDFDPGPGVQIITGLGTAGAADAFIASFSSAISLRWVVPVSAVIAGDFNFAITSGAAIASDGTLWAVGRFFGQVDFDPSTTAVFLSSLGDADQFVTRLDAGTGALRR